MALSMRPSNQSILGRDARPATIIEVEGGPMNARNTKQTRPSQARMRLKKASLFLARQPKHLLDVDGIKSPTFPLALLPR